MGRRKRWRNSAVQSAWAWLDRAGEIVPGTRAGDAFGSLGEGSCIGFPAATLMNVGSIHVGSSTLVGRQVTLSVGYGPGQADLPERGLEIGDRCVLGARTSLTAHSSVVVGDDVWFGQDVFVSDASHGYQALGTPIGRNVVVAAGSVVRGRVEDRAVVAGAPARVVRRFEPGVGWVGHRGDVRPVRER